MQVVNFSRSFITWRVDTLKKPPATASHKPPFTLNNARVQADCYCEIKDKQSGKVAPFILGVNCKTERVGVERDIWTEPNADFVPVMGEKQFLALKAFDRADKGVMLYPRSLGVQPERQVSIGLDAFDNVGMEVVHSQGEELKTAQQIIERTLANHPLVAMTEIENERYTATLSYPVKTMNANERDNIYQTDTGPVLFPDLSRNPDDLIAGFELAFAAFNNPAWVEFLLRVKTPVAEGVNVYHYSKSVRVDATNRIIALLT